MAAVIVRRRGSGYWPQTWPDPRCPIGPSCTLPHVSALHSSTLDCMKSLTDKLATVAAFALGVLGLVIALLGFEEPSPGWVAVGLGAFVAAVWLWVRLNPVTAPKHAADKHAEH